MAFAVLAAFSLACLFVLHPTECNACTCVTGATCDPLSGDCTCSLPNGFVCDKNNLTVSLTASQTGSITDTADAQQQVTLTCTINIPEADATVTIPRISNTPLTSTGSNGEYTIMLNDVHPGDSGVYRCDVTTTINGTSTVISSNDYTLDVNCADDYYGPSCTQRCNCVTGGMCNQASGVCNCTKPFATAVCDKDDLTVSLTASQTGSITDTADAQQQVTLTCTINIPEADATVTIPRISNTPLTSTGSNGEYTIMLNDVHPGDSGVYSCDVTTTINGVSTVTNSNNYTLDVNCADDFHGPSCTQRCNCVTGGMCNQASGVCDCTKPFATAVCDKDLLTVSLTSNQGNTVIDSSPGQQSVSLTCNVNLPDNDVTVVMTKLPSGQTISFATATNGVYRVDLVDVHPASSGTYRCTATRDINTAPMNLTDDYSLTVNCASDFYGPICDQPCNCVTGGTCNQNDGLCNCTEAFTGAVCDKDALAVLSVTSNPPSTVPDTSSMDNVTIQCRTNLPVTDVRVALTYPGSDTQIDMMHRMEGLYEQILTDVHESDSGEYTCIASVKPVDLAISKSGTYQLDIQDVDECTNPQYLHNCNQDATCNNIKGGFMCQCNAGYEGTGVGNTGCTVCTPGVHYGFNCQESCTCVTPAPGQNDVTCDNVNGTCTCNVTEFSGKTCDKRDLTVTLMPDPNPVLDRPEIDNITWNCKVNLHSRDLVSPVTITYPNFTVLPMNMSEEGLYERIQSGVTQNDDGRYTCTATAVGMDPVTGHFDLDVIIDGRIISVSDPVEGEVGDTVRINCTVYARSDVDIAWYFGNNQIIDDAKYAITNMSLGDFEQISYLTVHNLNATDNGSYVCSATNDTREAMIVVVERPIIGTIQVSALSFDQLRVSWVISFDGNLPPPICHVNYSTTSTGLFLSSPGSPVTDVSHIVTDLQPYTEYYVQVQCTNKVGSSNNLLGGPQRTLKTNPSEPRNLHATDIQPDRFNVEWVEPATKNGPVDGYKINVTRHSDGAIIKMAQVTGRSFPVEGLTAYTEYTVVVIAFNTEGGQDLASNPTQQIFRTAQDAPTPPRNVQSINLLDTCNVSWGRPENENGIIQSYKVIYSAYPRPESSENSAIDRDNSGSYNVNGNQMTFVFNKSNHAAYSEFRFNVSATTVAEGNPSDVSNGSCITNPAAPAEGAVSVPLQGTPDDPEEEAITPSSFYMTLTPADERNGPISCYNIIVKELNEDEGIDGLNPDQEYPQKKVGTYESSQGNREPYIAFVKDGSDVTSRLNIKIGEGRPTRCGAPGSRRKRQTMYDHFGDNGGLKADTRYTAFVRAFVKVGDGNSEEYRSSPFMQPIKTAAGPSVAGIAIGIILAILVIIVIVLGALIYMKRRQTTPLLRGEENGVAMVQVKDKEPEMTHMVVLPIPIEDLEEKVKQKSQNDDEVFKAEFKSIPEATGDVTRDATNLECNKEKNRYINIGAYDQTRVKLSVIDDDEGSDYINACYIDGYEKSRKFIAAQGPREDTVLDFWRMIWEQNCATIIMLTKCLENGREKCAEYWPEEDAIMYDDIIVTLDDVVTCADYVIRKFTMQKHIETEDEEDEDAEPIVGESRTLMQFHFLAWPDFGIPKYPHSMLCFVKRIRHMTGTRIEPGNIVVHCSAGVGRTGTYILIDYMLDMMKKEKKVDIYNVIYSLRSQRNLLVQSLVQYIFIHKALMEEYLYGHTEVDVGSMRHYYQKLCGKASDGEDTGVEKEYRAMASLPVDNTDQKTGNIEANKQKNRLRQVIPYDRNRVKLERLTGQEHSNYINASFIDGYEHKKAYVAAQGPLPNTMGDFWRMAWENQCSTIVMLSECEERGQNVCTKYWPEAGETLNPAFLTVAVKEVKEDDDCTIRDLEVSTTKGAGTKLIRQYHYHGWPEVGIPDNSASLVKVIGLAHEYQQDIGRFPILVHCSAGSGRTGVFIALSYLLQRAKAEGIVDVFQAVRTLRQQRPHMVQDVAQYQFCYRAMNEYLDSFDHYANFK